MAYVWELSASIRWIPAFLAWLCYYRQVSGTSLITWSVCCHVTGQDKSHPKRVSYVIALTMSTSTKTVSLIYRIFCTRFYLAFQICCCELATLPTNMHYHRESTYISESAYIVIVGMCYSRHIFSLLWFQCPETR